MSEDRATVQITSYPLVWYIIIAAWVALMVFQFSGQQQQVPYPVKLEPRQFPPPSDHLPLKDLKPTTQPPQDTPPNSPPISDKSDSKEQKSTEGKNGNAQIAPGEQTKLPLPNTPPPEQPKKPFISIDWSIILNSTIARVFSYVLTLMIGLFFGKKLAASSAHRFAENFRKILRKSVKEGIDRANINANIIIEQRDDFRKSLNSLNNALNGPIDKLKDRINKSEQSNDVFQSIEIIAGVWDKEKVKRFNEEVDKMLVDLGVLKSRR